MTASIPMKPCASASVCACPRHMASRSFTCMASPSLMLASAAQQKGAALLQTACPGAPVVGDLASCFLATVAQPRHLVHLHMAFEGVQMLLLLPSNSPAPPPVPRWWCGTSRKRGTRRHEAR